MKDSSRDQRLTIRLSSSQMQVLTEITEAVGVSYSLLVRTIILDFLQRNEKIIDDLIENRLEIKGIKELSNANYQQIAEDKEGED